MKKILFVGHRNMFFGAESVMFRITQILLQEKKAEIHIVLPKSTKGGFQEALIGLPIHRILVIPFKLLNSSFTKSTMCLIWNLYAVFLLFFYCNRNKVQCICSNTSVNIIGALTAFISGKQHFWYFHEQPTGGSFKWINKSFYPLYRFLISRKLTCIIFISNTQRYLWEQEFGMKIKNSRIIYTPPVEVKKIENQFKVDISYGYLGSWTASKNIIVLIKNFSKIKLKYPTINTQLVIMGEGELEDEIYKTIRQLKLQKFVILLKHSRDVSLFFSLINIFILPSIFESWGLTVLEALYLKKCVIVTKNTGLVEILTNNEDCIFIDPQSRLELFNAMEKVMVDENFRNVLIQNGFSKLNVLNLNRTFRKEIINLFSE